MLNSDYKDMLQVLLDNGVNFLLVGAWTKTGKCPPAVMAKIEKDVE